MLKKIRLAIEKRLRAGGIASPDMRRILSGQLLFAASALVIGLALAHFSTWPLAFALGSVLAALNLWWLARSVVRAVGQPYTPALAFMHLCGFLARFACAGGALYVLIVRLNTPLIPLLAGLSTVVAALAFRGAARIAGNSLKEA